MGVCYINEIYSDSYGNVCPKKLSKNIINEMDIFFLNIKFERMIVFCASYFS